MAVANGVTEPIARVTSDAKIANWTKPCDRHRASNCNFPNTPYITCSVTQTPGTVESVQNDRIIRLPVAITSQP